MMVRNNSNFCWSAVLFLAVFLQTGCATESSVPTKSFEYVSLQPSAGFSVIFNVEDMTVTPQIKSRFGVPPSNLEVCETESLYICFKSEIGNLVFSFPKVLNQRRTWVFNDRKFDIVEEISTIECGIHYIVKAETDGIPTELFEFSYEEGLRAIYSISSVEGVHLEFVEGETYKFGEILIANGAGFGAFGSCSGST